MSLIRRKSAATREGIKTHKREDKTHRRQCEMSSSKKLTCKGTLFICLRNPIPPPPLNIVYVYTVYLFTQGRGEES
jgi:hypothetical protein